jgi:hypothetical protein
MERRFSVRFLFNEVGDLSALERVGAGRSGFGDSTRCGAACGANSGL